MAKPKIILIVAMTTALGALVTASGAVGSSSVAHFDSRSATPALSDFKRFVADVQSRREYRVWAAGNPKDLTRWRIFRNGLLALGDGGTQVPIVPKMTTPLGRELADVGVLYLDGTSGAPGPNGGNGSP